MGSASEAIQNIPAVVRTIASTVRDPEFRQRARYDVELVVDLLRGKAKQTYGPLVSKLSRRAFFDNNSDFPQTASTNEPMAAE